MSAFPNNTPRSDKAESEVKKKKEGGGEKGDREKHVRAESRVAGQTLINRSD